jgi:hypothetical protein
MMETERYVNFITKHKITQSQFLFLYLLRKKRWDLMKKYKESFPSEDGTVIGKILRDDLLTRKFIIKLDDNETAASYQIGKEFKAIFVDAYEAAEELKEAYPAFAINNGRRFNLVLVDTYEIAPIYAERIGHELHEHTEVLEDLKYGIDQNLITCGLDKFIRTEFWKTLRKARKNIAISVESDETNF